MDSTFISSHPFRVNDAQNLFQYYIDIWLLVIRSEF